MASPYSAALTWLDHVRAYAPMAATLFGLLYAAGFVIVNSYLGTYGIKDLEAVRARYVGAGLVFLLVVALALVIVDNVRIMRASVTGPARLPLMLVAITIGPAGLALAEALVLWRALSGPLGDRELASVIDARLVLTFFFTNLSIAVSLLLLSFVEGLHLPIPAARFVHGLTFGVVILVFLGVVLAYADYVYPRLPGFLGGGLPSRARLVVSQAIAEACPPCVQDDVLVVDEEGNRIVILVNDKGVDVAVEIFFLPNGDRAIIHRR